MASLAARATALASMVARAPLFGPMFSSKFLYASAAVLRLLTAELALAKKGVEGQTELRAQAQRTAAEAKDAPAGSPLHKAAQAALDAVRCA